MLDACRLLVLSWVAHQAPELCTRPILRLERVRVLALHIQKHEPRTVNHKLKEPLEQSTENIDHGEQSVAEQSDLQVLEVCYCVQRKLTIYLSVCVYGSFRK